MTTYRVEKDGISFFVQPYMLDYYASNGYSIYKTVEEEVSNIVEEIASVGSGVPDVKEVNVNG